MDREQTNSFALFWGWLKRHSPNGGINANIRKLKYGLSRTGNKSKCRHIKHTYLIHKVDAALAIPSFFRQQRHNRLCDVTARTSGNISIGSTWHKLVYILYMYYSTEHGPDSGHSWHDSLTWTGSSHSPRLYSLPWDTISSKQEFSISFLFT